MSTPLQSVSLYYREGSSDKVYHVQLEEVSGGFVVNFQYGRRGSSLQAGTKTQEPVSRTQAEKVFARLVAEKKGKGYTEGAAGTPYSSAGEEKRPSGYLPQLANFIEEDAAQVLLNADEWCMQIKVDGVRQIVVRAGRTVTAANRKGLIVPISSSIAEAVLSAEIGGAEDFALDGEAVGDTYFAFDLLAVGGKDTRPIPLHRRLAVLDEVPGFAEKGRLQKVKTASTSEEKHALFAQLKADKAEGVVFKRLNAGYSAGRPASGGDVLKFKFYATATLGVIAVNERRSIRLGAWTIRGWQFVGNVTIPPNQEVPQPQDLVEVRYLYRYPEGSLFQPSYLGQRPDKELPDDMATLKVKQASPESEEQ